MTEPGMIAQSQRASRLTTGGLVVDGPDGSMVLRGVHLATWVALDGRALPLGELVDEVVALTAGAVDHASVEMAVDELSSEGLLCRM